VRKAIWKPIKDDRLAYSVSYNDLFALEFQNYPLDQQTAVLKFVETFLAHGLSDFKMYPGKISPSWRSLIRGSADYNYAHSNHLWHYHLGVPIFNSVHTKYQTSDVVLHFEWPGKGRSIHLVDTCYHYLNGKFYVPQPKYLAKP
jgi:hypothetical protein